MNRTKMTFFYHPKQLLKTTVLRKPLFMVVSLSMTLNGGQKPLVSPGPSVLLVESSSCWKIAPDYPARKYFRQVCARASIHNMM